MEEDKLNSKKSILNTNVATISMYVNTQRKIISVFANEEEIAYIPIEVKE